MICNDVTNTFLISDLSITFMIISGFIYGVPPASYPNEELIEMDVVALNHGTFDTGLLHLLINITQGDENEVAKRCVLLKIDNLNLEDIFDAHRLRLIIFLNLLILAKK